MGLRSAIAKAIVGGKISYFDPAMANQARDLLIANGISVSGMSGGATDWGDIWQFTIRGDKSKALKILDKAGLR